MKRRKTHRDAADFFKEVRSKQRNLLWPDTLANSNDVNRFLWRGSAKPSFVQRVGAWIFGATFIGIGLTLVGLAHLDRSFLTVLFASAWILVGARVFRNGFPRRR